MATRSRLDLQPRTVIGKQVRQLRRRGLIPATVYGKGREPMSVQVDERTFNTLYRQSGRTRLIDLVVDGKVMGAAFIQAIQRHPVTRTILHADFRVVDLKTAIHVQVPLLMRGESPLAVRGDAVVNLVVPSIDVLALPEAIPQHIDVDVSTLDDMDTSIHVGDLQLPEGVTTQVSPDLVLVSITPVRAEEEEAVARESPAEPELIREQREEEE